MKNNNRLHRTEDREVQALSTAAVQSCAVAYTPIKVLIRMLVLLCLSGLMLLHALLLIHLWPRLSQGYSDFTAFYSAGQAVRQGVGDDLYHQEVLATIQNEIAPGLVQDLRGPRPYTHPPFEAAVFVPLAALAYPTAYVVWSVISILALVAAVLLLRPFLRRLRRWSGTLPFLCALAFSPAFVCLLHGQDSTVLFLFFVGAFVAMKHHRNFLAGACFALTLIKLQYVVPIMAIFLLRRKWNVIAGFSFTTVLLTLASAAIVGWREALYYPRTLLTLSKSQALTTMDPQHMANLRGVLARLLGGDSVVTVAILTVVAAALIFFVARRCRLNPEEPAFDLEFSLLVTVSTLISYHLWTHDLILLLLPLLLVSEALFQRAIASGARGLLLPVVVLLFVSPLYLLQVAFYVDGMATTLFCINLLLAIGITVAILQSQGRTGMEAPTSRLQPQ